MSTADNLKSLATQLYALVDSVIGVQSNIRLREELKRCAEAEALIPIEQAKIQLLIDIAKNPIEKAAREYQFELIEKQLSRAAFWAKERLKHLNELKTEEDWTEEKAACKADTLYWFKWWAWSTDPRPDAPLNAMPLVPFEFQESYINWIENTVFVLRASGLAEKARDMGATVVFLLWCVKQFLFGEGFSALLTTINEDLVDSKKDPDTLFEKIRFAIRMMPVEMLPKDFDLIRDMPFMNIANPSNDAVLTGDAPTENLGRQRRRTVAMFDEAASLPGGGYLQHTAISQTVRSIFKISSVKGTLNKFADERHSGYCNLFEMDWRLHPWKDQRWYDSLPFGYIGPAMSKEEVAQEIDRNYEASQPGKVYKHWSELHHVITWKEFAAVVPDAINPATGGYRIPSHWKLGRGLDWGATGESAHPAVLVWVAAAGENAPASVSDCVFVYRERVWGDSPTVRDVATEIREVEDPEDESPRMAQSRMSHERKTERITFAHEHVIRFESWETADNAGIAVVNEYLQPRKGILHPFRPYLNHSPRMFLIVADDQGAVVNGAVVAAKDQDGLKRLRAEFPSYHYPQAEAGKAVGKMKPYKLFDDAMDALRGIAHHFFAPKTPYTPAESFEMSLPERIQRKTIEQSMQSGAPIDMNHLMLQRLIETREVKKTTRSYRRVGGPLVDRYPRR